MVNNPSDRLLEEIYQSAKMGMQAAQLVAQKAENSTQRTDIEQQYDAYHRLAVSAGERLAKQGDLPSDNHPLEKAVLWGSIQVNTIAGASPTKISEIMINGCNMGIVDLTKKMNDCRGADAYSLDLGHKFIETSEDQIERMKRYL